MSDGGTEQTIIRLDIIVSSIIMESVRLLKIQSGLDNECIRQNSSIRLDYATPLRIRPTSFSPYGSSGRGGWGVTEWYTN